MPQLKTFEREVSGKMKKTWVRLPQEKWPVSKDFSGYEIPTEELISKDIVVFASSIDNLINVYDIERFIGKKLQISSECYSQTNEQHHQALSQRSFQSTYMWKHHCSREILYPSKYEFY